MARNLNNKRNKPLRFYKKQFTLKKKNMRKITKNVLKGSLIAAGAVALGFFGTEQFFTEASSHREAPMISSDPLADNTDVYAFRSPDDTNTVTLIANYVPLQLPEGGPNYASFGENIRYEIHVDNNVATAFDDIIYRFTFFKTNEDSTTFFNIRFGENLKTTYTAQKSTDGGTTFTTIKTGGIVPPPNIGPRSIENSGVPGLGVNAGSYETLFTGAVTTASTGETLYCGPADDPFFVDLGGAFDLGGFRSANIDAVAKSNIHAIAVKIPINMLQKDGKSVSQRTSILDGDFVIGVYAAAYRPRVTTFNTNGNTPSYSSDYVQVSRLGMPLTNEVIIPIARKDRWNAVAPSQDLQFAGDFSNPELGLYMADGAGANGYFGDAVPALAPLRIQTNSLGGFDFRNNKPGLFSLRGTPALDGTALSDANFGAILLPNNTSPRAVDILPIFYTGVPNLRPYQLATGKNGDPLAAGKPFINNFLPTLGDYLRLNMAVPVTPRNSPDFSPLGIVQAAVLGLTDPRFNASPALQFIPNMDGFPNGRRLEDDVVTIELQAVAGVALAAIGLWYDDYVIGQSPVTPDLLSVLTYDSGPVKNDTTLRSSFPYVQVPWSGFRTNVTPTSGLFNGGVGYSSPDVIMMNYPNPFKNATEIKYTVKNNTNVNIRVYDLQGKFIKTVVNEYKAAGTYIVSFDSENLANGTYVATLSNGSKKVQSLKLAIAK